MWRLQLLTASLAVVLGAGPLDAADGCGLADSLQEARVLEQAHARYTSLLRTKPTPLCAIAGIKAVARARARATELYEQGRAFERGGLKEVARSAYLQSIAIDPHMAAAKQALDRILAPAVSPTPTQSSPFTNVRALARLGLHEDALTALKKVVAEHPDSTVPADLRYLSGSNIPGWAGVGRIDVKLGAAAFLLLAWVVGWRWGAKPRLIIEPVGGGNDASFGRQFTSMVEDHYGRITSGVGGGSVSLVTGPIEPLSIPAAVQTVIPPTLSWVNAIPAMAAWLVPRQVITVTGFLHRTPEDGAGITMTLKQGNRVLSTITTWEREYGRVLPTETAEPSAYYRLAEPAAIWLLYRLTSFREKRNFSLLGSREWRAFALFRAGVRLETQGDDKAARSCYLNALRIDPVIRGARVNLSSILTEEGEHEHARRLAQQVLDELGDGGDEAKQDPTYYSAQYRLAVIHFNIGTTDAMTKAVSLADQLVTRISDTLAEKPAEGGWFWQRNSSAMDTYARLEEYLQGIQPAAELLRAGIRLQAAGRRPPAQVIADTAAAIEKYEFTANSPQTHYNLACVYSMLAGAVATDARKDYLDKALHQFDLYLLLDGRSAKWATKDRALAVVSTEKYSKDRFLGLIRTRTRSSSTSPSSSPSAQPLALAAVELIGDKHAQQLAKYDIHSPSDLVRLSVTSRDRKVLAEKIGVSLQLVDQWAATAGLMQVDGLDAATANLLVLANVRSVRMLARAHPPHLVGTLSNLIEARGITMDAPPAETVSAWIRRARELSTSRV